jgi:hypothetical protein
MKTETNNNALQPLVKLLLCSPSCERDITHQLIADSWTHLRCETLNQDDAPSPAIMAALLLNNTIIAQLLTKAEQEQLIALVDLAIERYEHRTNPHNKLGNLIAGILKEHK